MDELSLYKELVTLQDRIKENEYVININDAVRLLRKEICNNKDSIQYQRETIESFLEGRSLPSSSKLYCISVMLDNVAKLISEKEQAEDRICEIRKELNIR